MPKKHTAKKRTSVKKTTAFTDKETFYLIVASAAFLALVTVFFF